MCGVFCFGVALLFVWIVFLGGLGGFRVSLACRSYWLDVAGRCEPGWPPLVFRSASYVSEYGFVLVLFGPVRVLSLIVSWSGVCLCVVCV